MGAWSPSLDGDLDPVTGVEWVGLACASGTNGACVLGYLAGLYWFTNRYVIRYDLSMILHHSKNWKIKDGEMDLIAQLLLETKTGAYIK